MSRPARLGRGLASLIPDSALAGTDAPAPQAGLRHVPLDEIVPNPEQPRHVFDPAELEALSDSIRVHGILSPLVVRRSEGRYILIAGERRLRAAALAGLSDVPVVVRDALTPREQLELALVENLQRSDLDPVESARGYERLSKEFGLKQDEIATRVGKDRSTVANAMRLLKLPAFALDALRDGRISAGHARTLIPLADAPDDLRRVLAQVIAKSLNVRATERLVNQLISTPKPMRNVERERREQTFDYATKVLCEALHTQVAIKPRRNGGGTIVVSYGDAEELERLISHIRSVG
ncbi:MAG: ParB/RepB/Spo0J family partition protein [Alphaproteobacteria bacterium]|nr:ParB/RepB/Spo0J family partition protein [Alphaproteobacteria bacterium]